MKWLPWDTAPKDGQWIIAACNDRTTVHRVSWGIGTKGDAGWCTGDRYFGDGLFAPFGGWIPCPQPELE